MAPDAEEVGGEADEGEVGLPEGDFEGEEVEAGLTEGGCEGCEGCEGDGVGATVGGCVAALSAFSFPLSAIFVTIFYALSAAQCVLINLEQ